jgi:hypothetical protein
MFGAISIFHIQVFISVGHIIIRFLWCSSGSYSVYVIATVAIWIEAGTLFLILFWQFPFLGNWLVLV